MRKGSWQVKAPKTLDLRAVAALRNKGGSIPPGDYLTAVEVDLLAEYVDKLLAHCRALRVKAEALGNWVVGVTAGEEPPRQLTELAAVLAQARDE